MTIRAVRIVKAKHAATAFTGDGARKFGGRWNSPGLAVVYASGSTSLAMLEMLVHLQSKELLMHYVLFEVAFDESLVLTADTRKFPKTWRKSPPPTSVQQIGDAWLAAGKSAVLRVPSVIDPSGANYVLNVNHPDFRRIVVGPKQPIRFDPRLIKT